MHHLAALPLRLQRPELLGGPLLLSAWAALCFRPLGSRLQPSSATGMLRHTLTLTPLIAVPAQRLTPTLSFAPPAECSQNPGYCQVTTAARHWRPFVGLQSSWHDYHAMHGHICQVLHCYISVQA